MPATPSSRVFGSPVLLGGPILCLILCAAAPGALSGQEGTPKKPPQVTSDGSTPADAKRPDATSRPEELAENAESLAQLRVERVTGSQAYPSGTPLTLDLAGGVLRAGSDSVPLADLVSIEFPRAARVPAAVEFTWLAGDRLWATPKSPKSPGDADESGERFWLAHAALGAQPIPVATEALRCLVVRSSFRGPATLGAYRERLLARTSSESDVVELATGAQVEGILERLESSQLTFSTDDVGSLQLTWEKLRSLVLASFVEEEDDAGDGEADGDAKENRHQIEISLDDGSVLRGIWKSQTNEDLRLAHEALGEVDIALDHVASVRYLSGRCRYLSDLRPVAVDEHLGPLFESRYPWRRDANVLGGPLRIGRQNFTKGLGVHAYSKLEFELGGGYERFQATIGLDDTARPPGGIAGPQVASVVFRVLLDDKVLLEEAKTYGDAPQPIDLAIEGGQRLTLIVDFGKDDLHMARDRADWARARIVAAPLD